MQPIKGHYQESLRACLTSPSPYQGELGGPDRIGPLLVSLSKGEGLTSHTLFEWSGSTAGNRYGTGAPLHRRRTALLGL